MAQEWIESTSDWRSERSEGYTIGLDRDISSANRTSLDYVWKRILSEISLVEVDLESRWFVTLH